MKRVACLGLWLGLLLSPHGVGAEETEPVFLSVTRRADGRDRLPSNISVLTQKDILQSGAKTLDEALERLPSVDLQKTGYLGSFSTLRMRGVPTSTHVQVLVDDQPLGGVSAQFVDLSQIPVENIERVEVVRGGSSVLYGANTVGGVVHVITKRHTFDRPRSAVGWQTRTLPTEKGQLRAYPTQIYSFELGAGGHGFDGYVNLNRTSTDGFQRNEDAKNVSAAGNGGYTFKNGARISLDLARTDHDTGTPGGTTLPIEEWDWFKEREPADPTQRVEQDVNTGRFKVRLPLGPFSLQSAAYGSDQIYRLLPSKSANPSFDQRNIIIGNDTRVGFPAGFMLGASYERDKQKTEGSDSVQVENVGAYAQQSIALGALELIPALRWDRHSTAGNVVNPRFTAVYHASKGLKLSANAARSFRAPSFLEIFFKSPAFNGNPDLRPETAWTFDLGAELAPSETIGVGVTGFYTRLRERIAATLTTYENLPRAEMSGVELESFQRLGAFTGRLSYTYQRAIANSAFSGRMAALRLTPRHTGSYELAWALPNRWSLTNTAQYVSNQFQSDDNQGLALPSYALWHARLTKKILAAELWVQANNITNKRYAEAFGVHPVTFATTYFPQPGRTFWAGVTVRFTD